MKRKLIERGKALLLFGIIMAMVGDIYVYIGLLLGIMGLVMVFVSEGE